MESLLDTHAVQYTTALNPWRVNGIAFAKLMRQLRGSFVRLRDALGFIRKMLRFAMTQNMLRQNRFMLNVAKRGFSSRNISKGHALPIQMTALLKIAH
jgi:hypothetical protein